MQSHKMPLLKQIRGIFLKKNEPEESLMSKNQLQNRPLPGIQHLLTQRPAAERILSHSSLS